MERGRIELRQKDWPREDSQANGSGSVIEVRPVFDGVAQGEAPGAGSGEFRARLDRRPTERSRGRRLNDRVGEHRGQGGQNEQQTTRGHCHLDDRNKKIIRLRTRPRPDSRSVSFFFSRVCFSNTQRCRPIKRTSSFFSFYFSFSFPFSAVLQVFFEDAQKFNEKF